MSRHFYAIDWGYGVGTYQESTNLPAGVLVPFDSAKARDAWVAADRFDNDWHRSVPEQAVARRMMRFELREFRSIDSMSRPGWRIGNDFYTSLGDAYTAFFRCDNNLVESYGMDEVKE